jgi:drug/metabolite transporter (DMT)-like permease
VIYGLVAAFGWGLSDLWAAIAGRRMGSGRTVVVAQVAAAALVSLIVVVASPDLSRLTTVIPWLVPNAFIGAAAFATLYRGLQLGPIAVVSPVLASYAVVPVLLSVVLLGESLGGIEVVGVVVTIAGAVLTSADFRALRQGTRQRLDGLPWAIASTLLFGGATYVMGWAAKEAGFLPSLWFGRLSMTAVFLVGAVLVWLRSRAERSERADPPEPPERPERPDVSARTGVAVSVRPAIGLAVMVGVVELLGTIAYARGAEVGLVSIVTAASATYPLIPVFGGVALLHERPAPNQYLGVAMVVGGLVLLGVA